MWETWIEQNDVNEAKKQIDYDKLAELAVSSYGLDEVCREMHLIDRRQYFIMWWMQNRGRFREHSNLTKIGRLLKKDHATIIHYAHHRKPSRQFEVNVEPLADFLKL